MRWITGAKGVVVPLGYGLVKAPFVGLQACTARVRVGHLRHDALPAGLRVRQSWLRLLEGPDVVALWAALSGAVLSEEVRRDLQSSRVCHHVFDVNFAFLKGVP